MTTLSGFLLFLAVLLYVKLIFLRAIQLDSQVTNAYEFKKQVKAKDATIRSVKRREELLPELRTLKRCIDTLVQLGVALLLVASLGWLIGVPIVVIALFGVNIFTRLPFLRDLAETHRTAYEKYALIVAEKMKPILKVIGDIYDTNEIADYVPHSREEMMHVIDSSSHLLTKDEKRLITHALQFNTVPVSEVMTPRSVVQSIDRKEVLGPLTLTDLHKTGHSRFPVTDGDLDHVVGVLYSHDVMNTQRQSKTTAEKVMDRKVFYVHEGQTLDKALAAFLRTKHHLFIVVNEFEETTGVITIEDVIEKLIGHKIVDEFDQYDDLRAVARLVATHRRKSKASERV